MLIGESNEVLIFNYMLYQKIPLLVRIAIYFVEHMELYKVLQVKDIIKLK